MKKIVQSVLSIALYVWCAFNLNAQVTFEGASDYGRIYDLTYDKTTEGKVYALTMGNHLLESQNNGEDWEIIYSFPEAGTNIKELRQVGETTLSFYVQNSPNPSSNTIYLFDIETLEISKQYTPPVSDGATKEWVNAYSIYEADKDIVLFNQDYQIGFANYSKVYLTVDGGDSWTEVYDNEDFDSVFPNNVAISPNNPDKFFISRSNGPTAVDGGLLVSVDAGATWVNKIPDLLFNEITFNPENPDIILTGTFGGYNTVENLYKSEDGGDTWQIVPITWDDSYSKSITHIAFNPNDVDNIMVLEGNEIAITVDGGINWDNYIYDSNVISYYYGLHASFNPFQAGEVLISTDYYPVRSTDGGITVNQIENPFFFATQAQFSAQGDQNLYYSVQRGIVRKNLTTQEVTPNYVDPVNYFYNTDAPKYTIDPAIEGRMYMFVDSFNGQSLFFSDDNGASLNYLKQTWFDHFHHITTDPNNSNKIWVAYRSSGTLKIDFTDSSSPVIEQVSLPVGYEQFSTFIDPADSNHVLIGIGGAVYQTLDNGASWNDVSAGLTLEIQSDFVYDIQQNPNNSNEFLIATTQGIFKSIDGAQNWTQVYVGNNVRKVSYSTVVEGQIAASVPSSLTTSTKILFSVDNGEEWLDIPTSELAYVNSDKIAFNFQEENIIAYISTFDLGVISYNIETAMYIAPPNDLCEDAIAVSCGETVVGQTNSATDTGENASGDVWYTFTGAGITEAVTLSLCDGGTDYDSYLRVLDACGGNLLASNDDFCGTQSELSFESDGTSTYYIMVEGNSTATGNFSLAVSCEEIIPVPDNDLCEDAISIACGVTVIGQTNTATDTGENASGDVWYTFTGTGDAETVALSLCDEDTDFDTVIRVFDACDGTEIIVNDDYCGLQSKLSFESDGTSTYYIMVEGYATATGNFSLAVSCEPLLGNNDNTIEGFSYYPNPTNNVINLSAQDRIENVAIFNILGQKVIAQNSNAVNTQIDVSNLVSGTYIMSVTVNGKTGTYKIIKE